MKHDCRIMFFHKPCQYGLSCVVSLAFIILFSLPFRSSAQLWTGNLGSPIVNNTFGAGSFPPPLPTGATSYTFSQGCATPGKYSLENFLFGCENNTWVVLTGDHTRDLQGNYMLVNSSSGPGTVLIDTVYGLCGNTTYQFAAWLANCVKSNACGGNSVLPNLTFTIESLTGTVLATYTTPDLPITGFKDWVEYGVCYTTPATAPTGLVMKIKCNTGGPCGSSFVMDDVTFRAAGPTIDVTLNNTNDLVLDLCTGYTDAYVFRGTYSADYLDPVLQWQSSADTGRTWTNIPGATTDTYVMPARTDKVILYRLVISERVNSGNATCSINSQTIWTNVHPLPPHRSLQQTLGCLNKDLTLTAPPFFTSYQWNGPNGYQSTLTNAVVPNLQYADSGLYTLSLTGDFGCTAIDSFYVNIFPGTTVITEPLYEICEGDIVNLEATGDGTYLWSPSTALSNTTIPNPVASPRDSIQYQVLLTNVFGCKDSAIITINVFKKAAVDAGRDKVILVGDTAVLNGSVIGTAVNYSWSSSPTLSSTSSLTPDAFPLTETKYTLSAVSTVGCGSASDEVIVKVYKEVLMPNAFTPNNDGLNDLFRVLPLDNYELVSFDVYSRWGEKIFSTKNAMQGWDGTLKGQPQATGIYVYYIEMKSKTGKKIVRKGTVMLIR